MKEFLYDLYSNDNFTLYLTIALVILVALFFIVLFFGKKDKKLQETQKLQKVTDGFKEEEKVTKIEVSHTEKTNDVVQIKPMDEPAFDDIPIDKTVEKEETKLMEKEDEAISTEPMEEKIVEPAEKVEVTTFEPDSSNINKEDSDGIAIPEMHFDELDASLEKELTDLENIKNEFQNIEIPDLNEKVAEVPKEPEIKEGKEKPTPVFSSVFVDPHQDITNTAEFELPTLKKEEKVEANSSEIPTFNIDDISGETYNIDNK